MPQADRQLWKRFWHLAAPYWKEDEKWKAWGLLALLVILLLGQTRFAVLFNEQTGEFTSEGCRFLQNPYTGLCPKKIQWLLILKDAWPRNPVLPGGCRSLRKSPCFYT